MRQGSHKARVQSSTSAVDVLSRYQGSPTSLTIVHKNNEKLRSLAVSEDGRRAAIAGSRTLKILVLYDDSIPCSEARDLRQEVFQQNWSTRTSLATTDTGSRYHETYDLDTAKRDLFDIEDIAWSRRAFSNYIATAVRNGKIVLYDIARPGLHFRSYHDHLRQVHNLEFNPHDGRYLLSGGQDGLVKLWDLRFDRPATTFPGRAEGVRCVRWSPTNALDFALGTDNGTIQHWSLRNNKEAIRKRSAHERTCNSIDWHPGGSYLASAGQDQSVKVWEMGTEGQSRVPTYSFSTPQAVQILRWRPPCFESVKDNILKQCTQLATCYREYPTIHLWDVRRPSMPFREMAHANNTGTTDMSWRSKDLLWAVGSPGDFQQFDIPYMAKPVNKYPPILCSATRTGDLVVIASKEQLKTRRTVDPKKLKARKERQKKYDEELEASPIWSVWEDGEEADASDAAKAWSSAKQVARDHAPMVQDDRRLRLEHHERFIGDDGVDEHFLTTGSRRHKRSQSTSALDRRSFTSTRADGLGEAHEEMPTEDLVKTMKRYKPFQSKQRIYVISPGYPCTVPKAEVKYMAQNYHKPPLEQSNDEDFPFYVAGACDHNAQVAQQANQHKTARTWQILAQTIHRDTNEAGKRLLAYARDELVEDDDKGPGPLAPINELFDQLFKHYMHSSEPDLRMAAELIKLLLPALPASSNALENVNEDIDEAAIEKYRFGLRFAGLHPAQAASVLLEHEEDLRCRGMHMEAAYLRKLAYPHFPEAFAWCREDKLVGVSPGAAHSTCSFCREVRSPFDGGTLWSWCAQCGHCVHIGCADECWDDPADLTGSGGKCPEEGCDCGCVPGWWTEKMEEGEEKKEKGKERVVDYGTTVGASRAVERVRGALRDENTPSSGKKVRVVSPERK